MDEADMNRSEAAAASPTCGGVSRRSSGKFSAEIRVNGRKEYLGYYDSPEEAAKVFGTHAIKCRGDRARLILEYNPKKLGEANINRSEAAPARSNYRGVSRRPSGKFIAEIRNKGRPKEYLGTYDSPEEAAKVFDKYAITYRGRHARVNFPVESFASYAAAVAADERTDRMAAERTAAERDWAESLDDYLNITNGAMAGTSASQSVEITPAFETMESPPDNFLVPTVSFRRHVPPLLDLTMNSATASSKMVRSIEQEKTFWKQPNDCSVPRMSGRDLPNLYMEDQLWLLKLSGTIGV